MKRVNPNHHLLMTSSSKYISPQVYYIPVQSMFQSLPAVTVWREFPASGSWAFTSWRTSHGPPTPLWWSWKHSNDCFPEDAEESWFAPTAAGDLLLLHHIEHPNKLYFSVLCSWEECSAVGHRQCREDHWDPALSPKRHLQLILPQESCQHLQRLHLPMPSFVWPPSIRYMIGHLRSSRLWNSFFSRAINTVNQSTKNPP